jgi:hypothetical protein
MKVIKHKDKWYLQSDTGYKEILLSTDTELQKDGVQAIDDEFLEWFVKNVSCEWVEVGYGWIRLAETDNKGYWVSIPDKQFEMQQEEPKQDLEKEMFELEQELDIPSSMRWHNSKPKQEIKLEDIFNDEKKQGVKDLIDAHKQATLKEAAYNYENSFKESDGTESVDFIEGAKWQQERTCNHNYILTSEQSIRIIKCLKCNNVQPI